MRNLSLYCLFFLLPYVCFGQKDDWGAFMAVYKDGPGSTVLNMSLKNRAPVREYPYLVMTGVKFSNCNDGLPAANEFEKLYRVSDSIERTMSNLFKSIRAGTFTYQCSRCDYYYVTDTNRIRQTLSRVYKERFPDYAHYIDIIQDEQWEAYLQFLYPNDTIIDGMQNEKVISNLEKEGDNLEKAREVQHWLYFSSESDRNCFIEIALQNKFKIEGKDKVEGHNPFQLRISRVEQIRRDSMNMLTLDLKDRASKCHGNYDGWETRVIR